MSARNRGITTLAIAAVLMSVAAPVVQAEVGVYLRSNQHSDLRIPFIFNTIVDGPDPFGTAWMEFSGSNTPRATLNPEGYLNNDGPPSLVYNPVSDMTLVAWSRNSASGYDVVVSHLTDDTWSAPVVLADSLDDELDPKLFVDPSDGTVHVVYWIDELTPRVMHRQAPADLSSWSPAEQVSDPGEPACRGNGTLHDGTLLVAYEAHNNGLGQPPLEIVVATHDGSSFSTETVEISYFTDKNWPEIHSASGRLWIDWVDSAGAVAWTRQNPQGQWEPVEYEPYSSAEELWFRIRGGIRLQVIQGP